MEDERIQERLKEEEKKRALEEKLSRQSAFSEYLKEKFIPKVDHKKTMELEALMNKKRK